MVRGGFGIFYDAFPSIYADNSMTNVPNLIPEVLFGVPWADQHYSGRRLADGCQFGGSHPQRIRQRRLVQLVKRSSSRVLSAPAINSFIGTFHTPRYQEWSLQMEQQLDDKSSFTLAYVGNHGIHIPITNYPNAFSGGAGGLAVRSR